jgi:hypothetical protein
MLQLRDFSVCRQLLGRGLFDPRVRLAPVKADMRNPVKMRLELFRRINALSRF